MVADGTNRWTEDGGALWLRILLGFLQPQQPCQDTIRFLVSINKLLIQKRVGLLQRLMVLLQTCVGLLQRLVGLLGLLIQRLMGLLQRLVGLLQRLMVLSQRQMDVAQIVDAPLDMRIPIPVVVNPMLRPTRHRFSKQKREMLQVRHKSVFEQITRNNIASHSTTPNLKTNAVQTRTVHKCIGGADIRPPSGS